jgi:mercuric ion binding protein
MKKLFATFSLVLLLVGSPVWAGTKTVTLSVPTMNCAACPITVRMALENVVGVQRVRATLKPPEAVVTFDDGKTSVEKLTDATKNAGYPSSVRPSE